MRAPSADPIRVLQTEVVHSLIGPSGDLAWPAAILLSTAVAGTVPECEVLAQIMRELY
jgi:hypothetical protein